MGASVAEWLSSYVKDDKSKWDIGTVPHTKQMDSTSCGLFCLMFAEKYVKNEALTFQIDKSVMEAYKRHMVDTLIQNVDETLVLKLCRICSMTTPKKKNADAQWVGCDECGMYWVHFCCLQTKNSFSQLISSKWVCDLCTY